VLIKLSPYPVYGYGQRLEARGELQAPRGAERASDFDYRAYLARKGVFALMSMPRVRVLPGTAGSGALRALLAFRGRCQAALLRALPEPQSSLAVGILLGLQSSIPDDVYATFSATGTSHILVVSGWNMTILGTMLAAAATRMRASRWLTFGATLTVIWTYSVFVGFTPTVIRAALMASLALLARSADRESEPWTLLAVACWAMVAAGRFQNRLRHALIIGEVAFAFILLAAAGLFLRGLQRFINTDPGWQVDGLVTASVTLRGEKYAEDKQRVTFVTELENRLSTLPGVQSVAIGGSHPVFGFNSSSSFLVEGQPEPPPDKYPEMFFEPVTSKYFETLGLRLRQGRTFNTADTKDHPNVVIINDAAARTFWPNENPVGKRISNTAPKRDYYEIVGIVNDLAFPGGIEEPYTRFEAFVPVAQNAPGYLMIFMRTSSSPEAMGNSLRSSIAGIDPELPVYRVRTARDAVNQGLGYLSLVGSLLGAFATLGVLLSVIGIYGVVSYTVAQRTGELGIRMALGAQTRDVLWLVLSKGAIVVLIGALIGVAGAFGVSRLLTSFIPTLPTRDPLILALTGVALVIVALVACYIPARRATRVDPLVALKSE
jgi:predicted permease